MAFPISRRHCLVAGATTLLPALAAAATPLTVSYTATADFAGVFIAKERGYFARRGLDVTLQLIPVAPNAPAALVSNAIQVGGTTPSVLLQAVEAGLDLVAVAGGGIFDLKGSPAPIGVALAAGSAVVTPQDLVGRRVGVPGLGAAIHLQTRKWLADQGVDHRRVVFVEVPVPQMVDVLKGGSVDAMAMPEPFLSRAVQLQVGRNVPSYAASLVDGVSTVLYAATRAWATANGATVKAFRDAIAEAAALAGSNREAALEDIGRYIRVPPAILRASPYPKLAPVLQDGQLRYWADLMRSQDMLRLPAPLAAVILK